LVITHLFIEPEFVALSSDGPMGSLLARISATAEINKGWSQMTDG
jgi:hypothetical protein